MFTIVYSRCLCDNLYGARIVFIQRRFLNGKSARLIRRNKLDELQIKSPLAALWVKAYAWAKYEVDQV